MSIAVPVECSDTLPEVVRLPWPHWSEEIVGFRPDAARYIIVASTRRSIWPERMSARPQP